MDTTTSATPQAPTQDMVWRPMSSAPPDLPGLCVDMWCAEDECRRTDCFWFEGRWCYEVFEAKYRVVPVKKPVAWMPAPTKPEGF